MVERMVELFTIPPKGGPMMIMSQEKHFIKARKEFDALLGWIGQADEEGLRIDQVERGLFSRLLAIGFVLLEAFVAKFGRGDVGKTVEREGRTLRRSVDLHSRRYLSIFGELIIQRFVYAIRPKQKIEYAAVDEQLGLPQGECSYVLEDWLQKLCVKDSFDEGVQTLHDWLDVKLNVRIAESINRRMAWHAESYRESQPPPPAKEEGEIIVVAGDGKGVPMRRPLEARINHAKRRGKGEKRNKKQMAYVGAAYTIDCFCRTSDDVIDEVCRKECAKDRPQPKHKRVWVEMTQQSEDAPVNGKTRLFAQLGVEVGSRDRRRDKPIVCLMDGERALWAAMRQWLPERTIGILDLYHVMEYLWKAAHCFHPEQSEEAEGFVTDRLRMLLEGKVGYLIGGLRRKVANLRGVKRKRLLTVIGYLENNRSHMHYDEYLAAGYPIGSGVIEGACRHVVKDRMELSGMRWTVHGAQSMLHLRSIYLNGDWKIFDEHRIQNEQNTLYRKAA
jgi:hypothetical protein